MRNVQHGQKRARPQDPLLPGMLIILLTGLLVGLVAGLIL